MGATMTEPVEKRMTMLPLIGVIKPGETGDIVSAPAGVTMKPTRLVIAKIFQGYHARAIELVHEFEHIATFGSVLLERMNLISAGSPAKMQSHVDFALKKALRLTLEKEGLLGENGIIKSADELDAFREIALKQNPHYTPGHMVVVKEIAFGGKMQGRYVPGGAVGMPIEFFYFDTFGAGMEFDIIEAGKEVRLRIVNGTPFELLINGVIEGEQVMEGEVPARTFPPHSPRAVAAASALDQPNDSSRRAAWGMRLQSKVLAKGEKETLTINGFQMFVKFREMIRLTPDFELSNWKHGWKPILDVQNVTDLPTPQLGGKLYVDVTRTGSASAKFDAVLIYERMVDMLPKMERDPLLPDGMNSVDFESIEIQPGQEATVQIRPEALIAPHGFLLNEPAFQIMGAFTGNMMVGVHIAREHGLPSELFMPGAKPLRLDMQAVGPISYFTLNVKNVGDRPRKLTGSLLFDATRE